MEIIITESKLRFKNPNTGQPTRAISNHYIGRRVTALVDGEERMFWFKASDIPFDADEEDMVAAIESKLEA